MGTLFIVSTPIGNLEDVTIRAIKTLFSVEIIACEDTRRTGILLQELKKRYALILLQYSSSETSLASREAIMPTLSKAEGSSTSSNNTKSPQLIPYHDHNEANATAQLIEYLDQGKSVALVSDAGTPLINDPGFLLVREARRRNIPVVSVPGASALLTALTSSGLPANTFTYLGYPPEKQSHRIKLFQNISNMNRFMLLTYILYCAPHKLEQTLLDMKEVFGDIEITIARELTKIHEEIWRGSLNEASFYFSKPHGEFVLLFKIL